MKNVQELTPDKSALESYLKSQGWLLLNEELTAIEIPGAGNMNFTLRIKTRDRSFIIKQSRPYVEKYPQVAAPAERAVREAEFYALVTEHKELKSKMPDLLGVDHTNYVIALEDLGAGTDYSFLYQKGKTLSEKELLSLIRFAADLHTTITTDTTTERITNMEMRRLNHEHIFRYPLMDDNGLDLDEILPGLKSVAAPYKKDKALGRKLEELGERYLSEGKSLLHGDYFPGSWLKTAEGIKVIDPEFCFFGDPEFEIGVTLAHLKMAEQPKELIAKGLEAYKEQAPLDEELCSNFMAVELIRRILGLAQLPLEIDLKQRQALLEEARLILVDN